MVTRVVLSPADAGVLLRTPIKVAVKYGCGDADDERGVALGESMDASRASQRADGGCYAGVSRLS